MRRREFLKLSGLALCSLYLPYIVEDKVIRVSSVEELIHYLADTSITPGTVIELADGIYQGDFVCTLKGTEENPIIIRPQNPGNVVIDGSFCCHTSDWSDWARWLHCYDIEFMNSDTDRSDAGEDNGVYAPSIGAGFFGCIMHDLHSDGINWFGGGKGEVSENVIYNNGTGESYHAIYTHNNSGGRRIIARNIFGNQLGKYALHIYSGGENYLKDYDVYYNVTAGDPTHTGGGYGLIDFIYRNNIHHLAYEQHGRYTIRESQGYHNIRGLIQNNEFIDLSSYTVNQDNDLPWEDLTEEGNIFYGDNYPNPFIVPDASGYSLMAKPATKVWLIPFSKSRRWLGSVTIYNRDSADNVIVDFSSLLTVGSWYRLRNGQNMTETVEFVAGAAVPVPMNIWTASHVVGKGEGENHLPVFGSFVIEAVPPVTPTYLPLVMSSRQLERWQRRSRRRGKYPIVG